MTDRELIDKKIDEYSEAFDFYMDCGKMPENIPPDDLLGGYMAQVIDDNPQLSPEEPIWNEVLKDSLLSYFNVLLQHFLEIERQRQKELAMLAQFMESSIEGKRQMWTQVCQLIGQSYSKYEVNIEGYKLQFDGENNDAVFASLARDWETACNEKYDGQKKSLLEKSHQQWEIRCKEAGTQDYEAHRNLDKFIAKYPALKEIVRIMGRDKEEDHKEKDSVVRKYLPLTVSKHPTVEEIDRVEQGDNIPRALPSELALMADADTESLFYKRYAVKELQQLSSPSRDKPVKTDRDKNQPRLTKGPIIVAIDTSGSMTGTPIKIATSLLLQLLRMAKKERRKCFLISFSVRAKNIDLSRPGNWRKLEAFLKDGYTGGTDGEQMLNQALTALDKGTFEMADVLIISDFCFLKPFPKTMERMENHRKKGTKFYGLHIGDYNTTYDKILDRKLLVSGKCVYPAILSDFMH